MLYMHFDIEDTAYPFVCRTRSKLSVYCTNTYNVALNCISIVLLFCFRLLIITLLERDESWLIVSRKIINLHDCYKTRKLNPLTKLETPLIFYVHFIFFKANYLFPRVKMILKDINICMLRIIFPGVSSFYAFLRCNYT